MKPESYKTSEILLEMCQHLFQLILMLCYLKLAALANYILALILNSHTRKMYEINYVLLAFCINYLRKFSCYISELTLIIVIINQHINYFLGASISIIAPEDM